MERSEETESTGWVRGAIDRMSTPLAIAASLGGVAVTGGLDYLTGHEISFSIIYLAPIALLTWASGRRAGLVLAVVAACVWGVIDVESGSRYSNSLVPVWNTLVRLGFFSITVWLIADLRRAHAAVQEVARQDPLTGVANSRAFREMLEREIARLRRTGSPLTLAYVDLDRFKTVNDTLGHAAGDELLRGIGRRLASTLRSTDSVARLGGDEFALLLPNTDVAAASQALERFRSSVLATVEALRGAPPGVGATIGAIVFEQPPASADEALRAADRKMYEGKRAGRGHVLVGRWPSA
jgi:diguanylate cyclase (GGDEF)-like protein